MKTLDLALATAPLADYVRRIAGMPMIVTTRGKPLAALVPIVEGDLEAVTVGTHPRFLAIIERSRARYKAEGGVSPTEMRRRLGLKKARRH